MNVKNPLMEVRDYGGNQLDKSKESSTSKINDEKVIKEIVLSFFKKNK